MMDVDKDPSVINTLSDGEIREMILNQQAEESDCDNKDKEENVPIDEIINSLKNAIKGREQRSFINEPELMSTKKVKEKLLKEKHKLIRQRTLTEMFNN